MRYSRESVLEPESFLRIEDLRLSRRHRSVRLAHCSIVSTAGARRAGLTGSSGWRSSEDTQAVTLTEPAIARRRRGRRAGEHPHVEIRAWHFGMLEPYACTPPAPIPDRGFERTGEANVSAVPPCRGADRPRVLRLDTAPPRPRRRACHDVTGRTAPVASRMTPLPDRGRTVQVADIRRHGRSA